MPPTEEVLALSQDRMGVLRLDEKGKRIKVAENRSKKSVNLRIDMGHT